MRFNVNTDAVVEYTRKLERLNRSAFPVAVRQTLNTQAFQTKNKELIEEYGKTFFVEKKSFPKAFSKVDQAKGFDLRTMKAKVGMTMGDKSGELNEAAKNMEVHQLGGKISRPNIPYKYARKGKDKKRNVMDKYSLEELDNARIFKRAPRLKFAKGNGKEQFIRTAIFTKQSGRKFFRSSTALFEIDNPSHKYRYNFDGGKFSVTPIYRIKRGRKVSPKKKRLFVHHAALRVNNRVNSIFAKHAEHQFKKAGLR